MKAKVGITHIESYGESEIEQGLTSLIADLGGIKAIIPPKTKKVLIKPNIVCATAWDKGVTVNLTLLSKLVQMIQHAGFEVIVGEGPGFDQFCSDTFEKLGINKLAEELGVPIYDFKKGERVTVKVPNGNRIKEVTVDKVVTECDFIISLAKLKTHCETFVSLSMKNMKGLLCIDKERLKCHLLGVNECLVDYNRAFKPHFALVEGLIGMEGIGPLYPPGKPIALGLLIAGQDAVAVDAVCCKIMHFEPSDIRHLKFAAEAGMGTIDLNEIEIAGEKLEDVIPERFAHPPSSIEGISPYDKIQIIDGKPCSNCLASLASYLNAFLPKEIVEQATSEIQILLGAKAQMKGTGKEIALGNCLKRYEGKIPFIPGCPPAADAFEAFIKDGLKGIFTVPEAIIPTAIERFFKESAWVTTVKEEGLLSEIGKEKSIEMFRKMLKIRYFEEEVAGLVASGQLAFATGFVHLYVGEEAVAVGMCSALEKNDYITSTHRGHGHCIAKGAQLDRVMAEIFGKETGYCKGKGGSMHIADKSQGILGTSGIVGAGIPIAVGAALSAKMRSTGQVCVSFFGDGASNTGAFHEGLNLAGVWKLPVVFVCENNLYGITVSLSKATAIKDIAVRAAGYGFSGVVVDGMDLVAVYKAAEEAVRRAREGGGPTLIECKTYRYRGHFEREHWKEEYRTKEEVQQWRKRDAIQQHRKRLIDEGILSESQAIQIEKEAVEDVAQSARFAIGSSLPPVEEALTDVYA